MSELSGRVLLEQSHELTLRELAQLRTQREVIDAEYRSKVEPLDRRIASLDTVAGHQRRALQAFESEGTGTSESSISRQPLFAVGGAKLTDVLEAILAEAGKPLHYTALADEALRQGVAITAKDPGAFVINYLRREPDRFCRTATAGEYALLSWGLPGSRRMDEVKAVQTTKARPRKKTRAAKGGARK